MAFKIGDKAKVVDKESFLYNKTVELVKIDNEVYIFYCEPKKLNFVVHKDLIQRTIEWESSPDKAEKNFVSMTNRQWLMWQLIDMKDEEFVKIVNAPCAMEEVDGHCKIYKEKDGHCNRDCCADCKQGQIMWLKQEYDGGNCR